MPLVPKHRLPQRRKVAQRSRRSTGGLEQAAASFGTEPGLVHAGHAGSQSQPCQPIGRCRGCSHRSQLTARRPRYSGKNRLGIGCCASRNAVQLRYQLKEFRVPGGICERDGIQLGASGRSERRRRPNPRSSAGSDFPPERSPGCHNRRRRRIARGESRIERAQAPAAPATKR